MTPQEYYMLIRGALPDYHRGVIDSHLLFQEMTFFSHNVSVFPPQEPGHSILVGFRGGGYEFESFQLTPECWMREYCAEREEDE